ncbi:hypothetical protein ACFL6S_08160 [Candidatus Poribacteria bacterium]
MGLRKDRGVRYIATCALYIMICSILHTALWGCGGIPSELELPTGSKGYVLYVFAKRTEVMIDFSKKDGISRGTKLDVFRMDVPNMSEPVKLGEIIVEKVGRDTSEARVTAITSSLPMERGDRVFPHPITIVTDDTWLTSRTPADGWTVDTSLSDERIWEACQVLPQQQPGLEPEIRQLVADTDVKPVWHPSVKSHTGDVFFRKVFILDATPANATLSIVSGGRTNIHLNGRWIGEAKEWPEINNFKVHAFLERERNVVAVQVTRDPRAKPPPALFLAITVEAKFE